MWFIIYRLPIALVIEVRFFVFGIVMPPHGLQFAVYRLQKPMPWTYNSLLARALLQPLIIVQFTTYTFTLTIYHFQCVWVMDTPSALLITYYCLLKVHLVGYYLRIRPCNCHFYCLATKKIKTLGLRNASCFFIFVSAGCYCFIQWTKYITIVDMLMQMVLEKLSLRMNNVLFQQTDAFGKTLLKLKAL